MKAELNIHSFDWEMLSGKQGRKCHFCGITSRGGAMGRLRLSDSLRVLINVCPGCAEDTSLPNVPFNMSTGFRIGDRFRGPNGDELLLMDLSDGASGNPSAALMWLNSGQQLTGQSTGVVDLFDINYGEWLDITNQVKGIRRIHAAGKKSS